MNEEKWIQVIDKIQMDDRMKQRLYVKCIEKKSRKYIKWRYYRPAIIGAIIVCMLVSAPIIARVTSNVLERMQEMDKKEIESLNAMIQAQPQTVEADSFSRALTQEEQGRKKLLLEEYTYKRRFPDGEIARVDGEMAQQVDVICYDMQNSKFYLPSRALTDEELLQIIDFNHKRDYSLQVMNKVEKPEVNIKDVNDMGIIEKARYSISAIYDIDAKNLEATVECQDEEEKAYSISFTQGKRTFSIGMEGEDLKIKSVGADLENELNTYKVVTKEMAENETVLYKKSKDLLETVFHVNQEIKSVWCNYFIGDGGRAQDRKIHYLFELEDGTGYIFRYAYESETLYEFIYMNSFYGYQTMMRQNDPRDLERGVKREQFEINLEK